LTFERLKTLCSGTELSVGEIGSAFSTLALEAAYHRVPWITVDPFFDYSHELAPIMNLLLTRLGEANPDLKQWLKNNPTEKNKICESHIKTTLENLDKALFSVTIMTNTLPKYSGNRDVFFETQLPALLRVTDREAYIFPYSIWEEGADGNLQCTERFYQNPAAIMKSESIAKSLGFDFELRNAISIGADSPVLFAKTWFPGLSTDFLTEVNTQSVAVFTKRLQ
jgi:hypothetical protein